MPFVILLIVAAPPLAVLTVNVFALPPFVVIVPISVSPATAVRSVLLPFALTVFVPF